ncbi:MAG: hypothetical protein KKA73_14095 [Chloroflexi bacterium]|nr:hypothetical protein [Chloroflexota bacterium]MBU1748816.1 hypothetical protein [Chloroflexota bacterium]
MKVPYRGTRTPVKREKAERYMLLAVVSFAATVVTVRLFLQLTGYPQVGSSELHLAHLLWGGLALFIASLLPLILANRWAYTAGALLSGIGVGLFIDEVGKFITQNNDYFYPPAAPIIYAFFMATVLVYLRVRRPPSGDPRGELYRVFDGLTEVLDHDLDPQEHDILEAKLQKIAQESTDPNTARLAKELLEFLQARNLELVQVTPTPWEKAMKRSQAYARRLAGRRRLKALLVIGLGAFGGLTLLQLVALLLLALSPATGGPMEMLKRIMITGYGQGESAVFWFLVRLGLEGCASVIFLAAAGLLVLGRDWRGVFIGMLGLLLSLTVVNLLVFYFEQFQAIFGTLIQFGLLLGAMTYRRWYVEPPE